MQIVLMSDAGPVPYAGIPDNDKAVGSAVLLVERFVNSGVALWGSIEPGASYSDSRWTRQQKVLAMALAVREGRLSVAAEIRAELLP